MNTNQLTAHEALRDDLKAYLDNELTPWRRLQVRRHLVTCPQCRMEVQDIMNITKQLQAEHGAPTVEETPLDAGLRSRILSDAPAADRTFETVATVPARRWRLSVKEFTAIGAISLVLYVVLLPVTQRSRENARRSSSQSNLKDIGLGMSRYDGNYDPGVAGSAPAPSNGPPAPPQAASKAAEPQAGATTRTIPIYGDGKVSRYSGDYLRRRGQPNSNSQDAIVSSRAMAALPDLTRRVHKEGSIGVAVKNAEDASDAVVKIVQGAGGFIAGNSLTTGTDNARNAAMEIRVPVEKFDDVLDQVGKLGEVKSKNISGEDLTERFSNADQARRILVEDLSLKEAQLRAAKERAARKKKIYVPGWEERTELRNLRIEAAQARARLELLRKTTDLSNISVQLQEKPVPAGEAGFWQSLNSTKLDAGRSFVAAAQMPLTALIWILAYSPLWLPALLAWRYFNRPQRNAA